jgi:hypothetical protein
MKIPSTANNKSFFAVLFLTLKMMKNKMSSGAAMHQILKKIWIWDQTFGIWIWI